MATSFECPRCQHRFVDASDGDQAFAECPQCGSLALPGALVTSTDSRVLKATSAQSMMSDEGAPLSSDADPTVAIPIPGVFSALLDADASGDSSPRIPSGEHPLVSDEDATLASALDSLEGDATLRAGATLPADAKRLPMSLLLTRGASAEGEPVVSDEGAAAPTGAVGDDDPSFPSLPSLPSLPTIQRPIDASAVDGPPPMAVSGESSSPRTAVPPSVALTRGERLTFDDSTFETASFDHLAHGAPPREGAGAPPPSSSNVVPDLDLGDLDLGLELPVPEPAAPRMSTPRRASQSGVGAPASRALTRDLPPGFEITDEGAAVSDDRTTELRTTPSSEGGALTLSELEAKLGGAGVDVAAIFQDPSLLKDDAFGALEQAFDEVSRRPPKRPAKRERPPAPPAPAAAPVDEISLITLRGKGDVPAPPVAPTVPSMKLRRRSEVPHLALSDEAIALAAYRIGEAENSAPTRVAPSSDMDTDDDMPPHLSEATDLIRPRDARPSTGADTITDVHEAARPTRKKARPLEAESEQKSAFSFARVAILALVAALAGAGAGAYTAPPHAADDQTARTSAVKQLASGNRFYQDARYDDALAAYRGALNMDRTYVQAHRAKAVALAKLKRYDEAAKAYEEYLRVSLDAGDAELVKEILARYHSTEGAP